MKWIAMPIVGLALLAGCGGGAGGGAEDASPPAQATTQEAAATETTLETLPWPPPDANALLGRWSRQGRRLLATFYEDGRFEMYALDDVGEPDAQGTYELDGSKLAFTVGADSTFCVEKETFTWEVGLDTGGRDELLHAIWLDAGCSVGGETLWTLKKVG